MYTNSDDLRLQAERRLSKRSAARDAPTEQRLLYELEIHREELEIQNEELRRAQIELKSSRDRFADLYDFAPVGYLTLNARAEIIEANLTACTMLDRERSRIIGKSLVMLCGESHRSILRGHLDEIMDTGEQQSIEVQFEVGGVFHACLETCRSNGATDGSYQCRTVITDITLRKLAEQAAMEKDRHLRSLSEALPVLISYFDSRLQYRFSNGAHGEWFGMEEADLIGRTLQETLGEKFSKGFTDYLTKALAGQRIKFESPTQHKEKGLRDVEFTLVPDFGSDRIVIGVHVLGIDITDRNVVEAQNTRRNALEVRLERLSADEKKAYELLICGKANKVIATELDIGVRTVERRRQSILKKLHVESVAELLQQLANIQGIETRGT